MEIRVVGRWSDGSGSRRGDEMAVMDVRASVICETDCLEALNLIHLRDISPTVDHFDLLSDIKALSNRDWTIHVTLIRRSANNAADLMAKCAARNQDNYFVWNQPSNDLM
ncbi:hypothetical protein PIB30_073723, partial [Stylosanthes scabra]|nr:hypothetical protein [Stylosanthes scabra]